MNIAVISNIFSKSGHFYAFILEPKEDRNRVLICEKFYFGGGSSMITSSLVFAGLSWNTFHPCVCSFGLKCVGVVYRTDAGSGRMSLLY